MKNLYFIRHGESEANVTGLVGTPDAVLTKKGTNQAITAGKEFREENFIPGLIISSPLVRAHDTAKLIAKELSYDDSKIEILDLLKERWHGDLEGHYFEEFAGITREFYNKNPLSIEGIPGVEKLSDLHKRAEKIVRCVKDKPEETILLVSHGTLLLSIFRVLNNIPYDEAVKPFENAKVIKLI